MRAINGKLSALMLAVGIAGSALVGGCSSDDGSGGGSAGGAPSAGAPAGGAAVGGAAEGGAAEGGTVGGGTAGGGAAGASEGGAAGASEGGAAGASEGGAAGASEGGAAGAAAITCPARVNNVLGNNQLCVAQFAIDECGTHCVQITSDACRACELGDTTSCYDDGDNTDGSSLLNMAAALAFYGGANDAARVSAGIAAEACMYSTGCGKAAGQIFTTCYCGTSGAECVTPGKANGPCKAHIETALETTAPLEIAMRIGDPSYPGGIAQIRVACDKTQCAAACLR